MRPSQPHLPSPQPGPSVDPAPSAGFGASTPPQADFAASVAAATARPRSADLRPGSPAAAGVVGLDASRFAKLCRDCGLVDGVKLTLGRVDAIFVAAAGKGGRRLEYRSSFQAALDGVAAALGVSREHVRACVAGTTPAAASLVAPAAFHLSTAPGGKSVAESGDPYRKGVSTQRLVLRR